LLNSDVQFSETSQAGYGAALYNTPEEFAKFNFSQIYPLTLLLLYVKANY